MTTVTLMWVGDLNQDRRMQHASMRISDERYRPNIIEVKENEREIKIGRLNSTNPPNYLIESCINKRMISRNHATVERLGNGSFMLYDHSMNGTYINYMRVSGGVTLKHGDIVCFGHINGANIRPGEDVTPFFSDLKYQVYIGPAKDAAPVEQSNKRQRQISQSSSIDRSPVNSASIDEKHSRSKKSLSSPKSGHINDDNDDDDEHDNDEDENEKNSSRIKSTTKKSNGQVSVKKHLSPPPAKKPAVVGSGSSTKHRDSQRKSAPNRSSSKPGSAVRGGGQSKQISAPKKSATIASSSEEDDEEVEEFHYDTEECSARPCKQPEGNAIDWIQCDKCSKWYHQVCLGLKASEADVDVYYCRYCKKH